MVEAASGDAAGASELDSVHQELGKLFKDWLAEEKAAQEAAAKAKLAKEEAEVAFLFYARSSLHHQFVVLRAICTPFTFHAASSIAAPYFIFRQLDCQLSWSRLVVKCSRKSHKRYHFTCATSKSS